MRGTLHHVVAVGVRWMLSLTSPNNPAGSLRRREALALDDRLSLLLELEDVENELKK